MGHRKTHTETETTVVEPFALKLPEDLEDIKPKWTIDLPGKHVGLIYEDSKTEYRRLLDGTNFAEKVYGYRYTVRNSKGGIARNSYVGEWKGSFYESLLDLKLAILTDAAALVPKTRTRNSREEWGYIEEGE